MSDWRSDPRALIGTVIVAASAAIPAFAGNIYWTHTFLVINLLISVVILQNMLLADAGQVSFGQGAIFGVAAYTVGIVSGLWGYDYLAGAILGVCAAGLAGLLFALPALRVQGYYLGFVTLSAAIVFPELLVAFNDFTNGINGINRAVPSLAEPFWRGFSPLVFLITGFAALMLFLHKWLRQSRLGTRLRVVAASPEAGMTLGFRPGRLRFFAFIITGLGTGIAGALYVPLLGFVSPYAFKVEFSIFFFFSVIVGGSGRLLGPIAGVWLLYLIPNVLLVDLANYRLLGYGIATFVFMMLLPDGIVGSIEKYVCKPLGSPREIGPKIIQALTGGQTRPTAATPTEPAVRTEGLTKAYGKLVAVDQVSVTIGRGTVHGLVGPNGSGKTTLLNILSGLVPPDGGRIWVNGVETTGMAAHRGPALGLGRTFQTPRIFEDLTTWENLVVGGNDRSHLLDIAGRLASVKEDWSQSSPASLPHGQRRFLEVMRVIDTGADILMLDEPAAGLSPEERNAFADMLRNLRDAHGKTIILIEHDLHLVWKIADRITVLDSGSVVAEGTPADIMHDPRVSALFTGGVRAEG